MTLNVARVAQGWGGKLARGAAILALLGSAACQQGGGGEQSQGGMFGGMAGKQENRSRDSFRSARAEPSAPAPAPSAAPAAIEPVAPGATVTPAPTVAPSTPVASADGQDRRVRVQNQSGQRITIIKGSAATQNDWGRDRIPSGTLPAGNAVIVDFNDNNGECVYDLQATLEDGTKREQRAVNICRVTDWIVTSEGATAR